MLCTFLFFAIPIIDDKPLIAHKDAVEKYFISDQQKWVEYRIFYDKIIYKIKKKKNDPG